MNAYLLAAAVADLVAVVVHGVVGYRVLLAPLTAERLFATRAFGDAHASRRVLLAGWHLVTAAFAISAAVMGLLSLGVAASPSLALFVSAMHASFLVVGLGILWPRLDQLRRPIPAAFVACMSTVCLLAWHGSG